MSDVIQMPFDWRPLIRDTAELNYDRQDEYTTPDPARDRARVVEAAKIAWAARMMESLAEPEHDLAIRADIDEFLTALRNSGVGVEDAAKRDEFLKVVVGALIR